jgi:hypothetical protein
VLLTIAAWLWLGRISPEEQARRLIFARFIRYPLDVALLGDPEGELRRRLKEIIAHRASAAMSAGYRTSRMPEERWVELAQDPSVKDPDLLHAALTLARLSMAGAPPRERATLRALESCIFRKVLQIKPDLLDDTRTTPPHGFRALLGPCLAVLSIAATCFAIGNSMMDRPLHDRPSDGRLLLIDLPGESGSP